MAAFIVVQIDVSDAAQYEDYKAMAPPSIAKYGGRYVVRGGEVDVLEGSWKPRRFVVLEFPDAERARAWWASEEYADAKALRHRCARSEMILVQGVSGIP